MPFGAGAERVGRERLLVRRRRAVIRRHVAGEVAGGVSAARFLIGLALAGIDPQRIDRAGQPALHRGAHGRRSLRGKRLQAVAVEIGIVGVERPFGERDGLAAEAADLLEAADAAGDGGGDVALHLVGGRAFGDEAANDFVEPARDRVGIGARLQVDLDLEDADPVKGLDVGLDRDGGLVAADQSVVEPRAGEAAEHAGGGVERRLRIVEDARHDPFAIEAGRRNMVVHHLVDAVRQGRHGRFGGMVLGAARNVAEIAGDERARVGERDVAGEHQHGIVRAIMGAEPVLHRASDAASRSAIEPMVG